MPKTIDKACLAREYGCEHVIVTRDDQIADAVQRLAGGADALIDGLGAQARDENFAALARRGHWVSLGQAADALDAVDANALIAKSIAFSRAVVFDDVATRIALQQRASRLWAALADGSIMLPPIERHLLESAAAAHARLESRPPAAR
jgi:NADPH:quinone reductase-like Zn-dependent oxidoreductase